MDRSLSSYEEIANTYEILIGLTDGKRPHGRRRRRYRWGIILKWAIKVALGIGPVFENVCE
jgi:hypothetical protein